MLRRRLTDKKIEKLVGDIIATYKGDSGINFIDAANLPVRSEIVDVLDLIFEVLFPGRTGNRAVTRSNVRARSTRHGPHRQSGPIGTSVVSTNVMDVIAK